MPTMLEVEVERLKRGNGTFEDFELDDLYPLAPLVMKVLPTNDRDPRNIIEFEAKISVEDMAESGLDLPSKVYYDIDLVVIEDRKKDGTVGSMVVGYQFYGRRNE